MKQLKQTVLMLILLFSAVAIIAGCNTMEGAGEDIEEAGDFIEDTAEDASS